jgi:hypothetical protein
MYKKTRGSPSKKHGDRNLGQKGKEPRKSSPSGYKGEGFLGKIKNDYCFQGLNCAILSRVKGKRRRTTTADAIDFPGEYGKRIDEPLQGLLAALP